MVWFVALRMGTLHDEGTGVNYAGAVLGACARVARLSALVRARKGRPRAPVCWRRRRGIFHADGAIARALIPLSGRCRKDKRTP